MQIRYRNRFYQKSKSEHNSHILYIWLLSYLVICLILSCCSMFLYSSLVDTTQNHTEQQQKDSLNKIAIQFDNNISFANKLYSSLSSNSLVSEFIYGDLSETQQTLSSISLARELTRLISTTKFSDAYIRFNDKDLIVGTNQSGDSKMFFDYFYSDSDLKYGDWIGALTKTNYGNYLSIHGKSGNHIDIMYQLPLYANNTAVRATLVIRMSDTLLKELTYSKNKIDSVAIIAKDGRLIMADSADLPPIRDYADYSDDTVSISDNIVCVCQTSSRNGWKYLYFGNNAQFYKKLAVTKRANLVFMLLSLTFCCCLGVWFSFKNYHPLSKLIKTYKKQVGLASDTPNSYKIVEEALSDYIDSKQTLYVLENQKQQSYTASYLTGLLTGTATNAANEAIEFPSDLFSVILFSPYDIEKMFDNGEVGDTAETENITFFVIQNIMEELLGSNDFCKIIRLGDRIVATHCYKNEQSAQVYKTTIYSALTHGLSVIKSNFRLGCNVGISSVRRGAENLSLLFNEAKLAVSGDSAKDGIAFYDELYSKSLSAEKSFYASFNSRKDNLIKCITVGDIENAEQILDKILSECIHSLNIEKAKIVLLHLESTLLSEFDLSDKSDLDGKILTSMNFDNLAENFEILKSLIGFICDFNKGETVKSVSEESSASYAPKKDMLLTRMIDYVRENYTDYNLNVNAISEKFNLSSYYVSKIFKNATGEALSDFIARLRVQKAKNLLETTELSMSDIYEQSGFSNEKTFARTFSKYEALTPSKYRRAHKKQ